MTGGGAKGKGVVVVVRLGVVLGGGALVVDFVVVGAFVAGVLGVVVGFVVLAVVALVVDAGVEGFAVAPDAFVVVCRGVLLFLSSYLCLRTFNVPFVS